MTNQEFLERVREHAIAFDKENGAYPENEWEGFSFYEFTKARIEGRERERWDTNEWEQELKK